MEENKIDGYIEQEWEKREDNKNSNLDKENSKGEDNYFLYFEIKREKELDLDAT